MICKRHPSSKSFMNPDTGKPDCWDCYKESGFNEYDGKMVQSYSKVPPYYLRMLLRDRHSVIIEVWALDVKTNKYSRVGRPIHEGFMSTATRRWKQMIKNLDANGSPG